MACVTSSVINLLMLLFFVSCHQIVNSFPHTGFYQPLTLATYQAPPATTQTDTTTGTGQTVNRLTPETTLPDGSTKGTYVFRMSDGQVYTIGYTSGGQGFKVESPVAVTGTATTSGATGIPAATASAPQTPVQSVATVPQQVTATHPQAVFPWNSWVLPQQYAPAVPTTAVQQQPTGGTTGTGGTTTTVDQVVLPVGGLTYGTNALALQQLQQLLQG